MKKVLLLLIAVLGVVGFFAANPFKNSEKSKIKQEETGSNHNTVLGVHTEPEQSIFIPYWTFGSQPLETSEYDALIYFGIGVDKNGIDTKDPGYDKVQDFIALSDSSKKRLLTVRMVDQEVNSEIIKNDRVKQRIITDSIKLAQQHGFDGIVLDFETSALSFDTVTFRISDFHKNFYQSVKKENMLFYATLYGDTYYRVRPYDVKVISENADRIFIMAYDFHKSRGNPGPNFPLKGREKYGYDFETMISDFVKDANPRKLSVVFGMFGYDWAVTSDNMAKQNGVPESYNLIRNTYITECQEESCSYKRDSVSGETMVEYQDAEGEKHIIWFEDPQSAAAKKKFLEKQGIRSYSYWAYSFF